MPECRCIHLADKSRDEGLLKLKEQTIQTLENSIKEQEGYIKQLT